MKKYTTKHRTKLEAYLAAHDIPSGNALRAECTPPAAPKGDDQ